MKKRRLSLVRVAIAVLSTALIGYGAWSLSMKYAPIFSSEELPKPWVAPYVDVTATPSYDIANDAKRPISDIVLSFIVSSPSQNCTPSWGGFYSLDEAKDNLELDRQIEKLHQDGASIAISFGGQANKELALNCTDNQRLVDAYRQVIDRYHINSIDFDIEGDALEEDEATDRRAAAIAAIQKEQLAAGQPLDVWVTLPVGTQGLTEEGEYVVKSFLDADVDLAGVNAMTMNYGEGKKETQTMGNAAIESLRSLHTQLLQLYSENELRLNDLAAWRKVGVTPMIGQNDIKNEVFTLDDAVELGAFASEKQLGRIAFWSANRDQACGANSFGSTRVSDLCSGIEQESHQFAQIFSDNFEVSTKTDPDDQSSTPALSDSETIDDPSNSPYPIWNESSSYIKGSKIVWKHNVYQAKWWTQGDVPDMPVLNESDSPWKLVGPVLPGEQPQSQSPIPEGVFPQWDGNAIYEADSIVICDNQLYRAKWWTQGDSPEAAAFDPGASPWEELDAKETEQAVEEAQMPSD